MSGARQRRDWRTTASSLVLLAFGIACAVPGAAAPSEDGAVETGRRLFAGEAPIVARMAGHAAALPASASRCANCHTTGAASPGASAPSSFGPALTADHLTRRLPRRGGPPSAYDEAAFCKLLRTGIDPAWVMVVQAMPRYELDDAQCRALWRWVTR